MESIKNKYEIILGFVTLIISLSAFKDELSNISIETGLINFTLSDFLLWIIIGFSICLYLYVVEKICKDTKIGHWKIFNVIIYTAYFLFTSILITPILIGIGIGLYFLYKLLPVDFNYIIHFLHFTLTITTALTITIILHFSSRFFVNQRNLKLQDDIEIQEIKDLDNAIKFFNDGYYSHSVLESYKVLEAHLFKKLIAKQIRIAKHRFNDLIQLSLKENIINQGDLPSINDIKEMRNTAAHSDSQHTKKQAELALEYVKKLIKK